MLFALQFIFVGNMCAYYCESVWVFFSPWTLNVEFVFTETSAVFLSRIILRVLTMTRLVDVGAC